MWSQTFPRFIPPRFHSVPEHRSIIVLCVSLYKFGPFSGLTEWEYVVTPPRGIMTANPTHPLTVYLLHSSLSDPLAHHMRRS